MSQGLAKRVIDICSAVGPSVPTIVLQPFQVHLLPLSFTRSMSAPSSPLDIEAQSHQDTERLEALSVRQSSSISAGSPEVNPNTRKALFVDTCPEICLQVVIRHRSRPR